MNLPGFTMLHHLHARPYARRMALFITLLLAMGSLHGLKASTTDGPLRMEVITSYNFVVDSNIEPLRARVLPQPTWRKNPMILCARDPGAAAASGTEPQQRPSVAGLPRSGGVIF